MVSMARWCCCDCVLPEVAKDYTQNNNGSVNGITGSASCTQFNTTVAPASFTDAANYWMWQWHPSPGSTTYPLLRVYLAKVATTITGPSPCSVSLAACEWAVEVNGHNSTLLEATSGFGYDETTGVVFGNHTFTGYCRSLSGCAGTVFIGVTP